MQQGGIPQQSYDYDLESEEEETAQDQQLMEIDGDALLSNLVQGLITDWSFAFRTGPFECGYSP